MGTKRIAGITVEIGGDTTKLTTALKDVDKSLSTTQSSLRDVNKLLKLDPGNTELLTQKQRLLNDAVNETKERLTTLKSAAEQANTALANGDITQAQYDSLQREIVETEQKLKSLEEQASKSSVALQQIGVAGEKLQEVGDKISGVGETLTKTVTVPIVGLGTAAVTTAATFESSMSQVQATMGITSDAMSTVNGQSVNTMDTLSDLAKQMGSETAFSASECAEALNYLALAGYDTQEMCDTLPTVLNLAAAGGIDLASASDMVTDAMSALGMGTDEATTMVDQMAKTSSTTNTSVSQLGEAILTIGATAKSVKGGTAELNTALGILANNGIKGAEGGTHLRNVILSLQSPTDTAAACMEELGLEVYDSEGNMRSLNDILGDLNSSMDSMTSAEKNNIISTIFNKTDLSSVNALLANTGDTWDSLQQSILNSGGAAQQMADTQLDNLSGQITILKSALEGLAISFGELLLPAIKNIVSGIQSFVDWLNSLDEGTKQTIVTIGLIVAAVGPVLIVIGKVVSAVGTVLTAISKVGTVISAVKTAATALFTVLSANPIGLVVAAIAALIAIFVTLWNNCDEFREFWINLWEAIKSAAETVWNALKDFFSSVWSAIVSLAESIWDGISDFFSGLWEGISNTAQTIWNGIKTFLSGIWDGIRSIFSAALESIQTTVSGAWDTISSVTSTVVTAIRDFLQGAWDAIKSVVSAAFDAIKSACATAWDAIKNVVTTAMEAIKTAVTTAWNAVKEAVITVMDAVKTAITAAWEAVKTAVTTAVTAIKETVTTIWESIKETVTGIMTGLKDALVAAWNALKEAVTNVVTAIGTAVSGVFSNLAEGVSGAMSKVLDAVKTGFNTVKDHILGLGKEAISWGKDLIMGIVDGIKSAVSHVKDAVSSVADTIRSFLHFSVPDEGPLADYESWMPDFMSGLAKGIEKGRGAVRSAIETVADDMTLQPTVTAADGMNAILNGGQSQTADSTGRTDSDVGARLDAVYEVMTKYLPRLANRQIVLDSGTLVGELSDGMNRNLGRAYL